MKNYYEFDEDIDMMEPEPTIRMKCINCGYEEDMPAWLYGEFADTEFSSYHEPPCFVCIKCNKETLYKKGINLINKNTTKR